LKEEDDESLVENREQFTSTLERALEKDAF